MLLSKKPTKTTTAKTLAKAAVTLKTTIEFALQPLMADIKIQEQLDKITQSLQTVEKSLSDKSKQESDELTKTFSKTEDDLDKLAQKIQGFQEYHALSEKSLQEKLLSRINQLKEPKKDAKAQEEYKKQAENIITEIRAILDKAKTKLDTLADKTVALLKQLKSLQPKITVFTLPETIAQSDKQAKKLKERLEALCEASTVVDGPTLSHLGIDRAKFCSTVPELQAHIRSCNQLIDQTLLNLKPLLLSNGLAASFGAPANTNHFNNPAAAAAGAGAGAIISAAATTGASVSTLVSTVGPTNVAIASQDNAKNDPNFKMKGLGSE